MFYVGLLNQQYIKKVPKWYIVKILSSSLLKKKKTTKVRYFLKILTIYLDHPDDFFWELRFFFSTYRQPLECLSLWSISAELSQCLKENVLPGEIFSQWGIPG